MTRKDLIELALLLGRETKATPSSVTRLLRLSATRRRMAEEQCNREFTPKEQRKYERVGKDIAALATDIGATGVILSGDPRGCAVKLTVASKRTNDFGQEGICIL